MARDAKRRRASIREQKSSGMRIVHWALRLSALSPAQRVEQALSKPPDTWHRHAVPDRGISWAIRRDLTPEWDPRVVIRHTLQPLALDRHQTSDMPDRKGSFIRTLRCRSQSAVQVSFACRLQRVRLAAPATRCTKG